MMNQCGCDRGHNMMTVNQAASRGIAAKRIVSRTMFN